MSTKNTLDKEKYCAKYFVVDETFQSRDEFSLGVRRHLSGDEPTVLEVRQNIFPLCLVEHDIWVSTYFYGKQSSNRGVALHSLYDYYHLSNNPHALISEQVSKVAELYSVPLESVNLSKVFKSDGSLERIQYDMRVFSDGFKPTSILLHFFCERVGDYLQQRGMPDCLPEPDFFERYATIEGLDEHYNLIRRRCSQNKHVFGIEFLD
jgi:hypothetical protein